MRADTRRHTNRAHRRFNDKKVQDFRRPATPSIGAQRSHHRAPRSGSSPTTARPHRRIHAPHACPTRAPGHSRRRRERRAAEINIRLASEVVLGAPNSPRDIHRAPRIVAHDRATAQTDPRATRVSDACTRACATAASRRRRSIRSITHVVRPRASSQGPHDDGRASLSPRRLQRASFARVSTARAPRAC
jgi:hypothetical protein